jgi:outer membrane protein assembly factor BamB
MKRLCIISVLVLVLALMLPVAALAQEANEWSQYQKGRQHAGASDVALPASADVARRTPKIDARECSQPVVAGNKAYVYAGVSGASGAVYCFDLSTGEQSWKTDVDKVTSYDSWSSPAVSEGVVYIGSGTKVSAMNGATGQLLWTKDLNDFKTNSQIVNGSPAIDGNRLIIADWQNATYYCLDVIQGGQLLWSFALDANSIAQSTPCIDSGKVFVGQGSSWGSPANGKVWCLDEATGNPVTSWGTNGCYVTDGKLDVTGTVAAYRGFIYFTDFTYGAASSPNAHLYCLSGATGQEMWKQPVYGSDGAPAVADGLVVVASQQAGAWPAPSTNWVTAFAADTSSGTGPVQLWTKSGFGGYNMSPCISGDKIAVGNIDCSTVFTGAGAGMWVLNAGDGTAVWQSAEGGGPAVPTPYGMLSIGNGQMVTFGNGSLPSGDFYFAEGCTRTGYQEWICLENPTAAPIDTIIEYMVNGGGNKTQNISLPPTSRTTVDVNAFVGPGLDVSAHVTGNGHFVAERSMYFKAGGINGGEQVMGVGKPGQRFLFAEGTTRSGFQTWLALQNPGDSDANVLVTYLYGDGTLPAAQNVVVKAKSRQTVDVNLGAGSGRDVSIALTANRSVLGERVMYFTYPGTILGSQPSGVHNCTGAAEATTEWYFAEGTTRSNFQEYLSLMNPSSADTSATIQYMNSSGPLKTVTKTLKANSRTTVDVNTDVGADQDLSALVTGAAPIVAERPMYFQFQPNENHGPLWKGGHNSIGAEYAAYKWEFAEGCTRDGFQTYLCIANPNKTAVDADISFFITALDGSKQTKTTTLNVPANSRQTLRLESVIGQNVDVSETVTCKSPVVVERPMYFSNNSCTDGGVALGIPGAP